eukprot:scaffold2447_cov110-Cylindrotheca_fusiformis.AAC.11
MALGVNELCALLLTNDNENAETSIRILLWKRGSVGLKCDVILGPSLDAEGESTERDSASSHDDDKESAGWLCDGLDPAF